MTETHEQVQSSVAREPMGSRFDSRAVLWGCGFLRP
jgi:hypothetical protein